MNEKTKNLAKVAYDVWKSIEEENPKNSKVYADITSLRKSINNNFKTFPEPVFKEIETYLIKYHTERSNNITKLGD